METIKDELKSVITKCYDYQNRIGNSILRIFDHNKCSTYVVCPIDEIRETIEKYEIMTEMSLSDVLNDRECLLELISATLDL